jgi:hypothetical protein
VIYPAYTNTANIVTASPRYNPRAGPGRAVAFFSTPQRI